MYTHLIFLCCAYKIALHCTDTLVLGVTTTWQWMKSSCFQRAWRDLWKDLTHFNASSLNPLNWTQFCWKNWKERTEWKDSLWKKTTLTIFSAMFLVFASVASGFDGEFGTQSWTEKKAQRTHLVLLISYFYCSQNRGKTFVEKKFLDFARKDCNVFCSWKRLHIATDQSVRRPPLTINLQKMQILKQLKLYEK